MQGFNKLAIWSVSIALMVVGCRSVKSHPTSSEFADISMPYSADYELQSQIYHMDEDSSLVYLKLSSQMLARRRVAELDGCYFLQIQLMVIDSLQRIIDTVKVNYKSCLVPEATWLLMEEKVFMPKGQFKVLAELHDGYRNSTSKEVILADKRDRASAQNFRLLSGNGEIILGNHLQNGQHATLESRRNASMDSIRVTHFVADTKLPPPPFSSNSIEVPDLKTAIASTLPFQNGRISIKGLNSFQWYRIGRSTTGLVVRSSAAGFPELLEAKQLHPPMRYITTKAEYDEMTKSSYSKPLVDQFWMESGVTKERAKELIRIYYSRVERVNRLFSNHTEGWRTDRGMIYLVFGQPVEIEQSPSQEIWYYGSKSDDNVIAFTFNKSVNALGQNQYILRRDPYYKTSWEAMVNAWRNGRIRE